MSFPGNNSRRLLAVLTVQDAGTTVWLVILIAVALALLIFCLSAVVSIIRAPELTTGGRVGWLVGVLIFQFFGPVVWFAVGRRAAMNGSVR